MKCIIVEKETDRVKEKYNYENGGFPHNPKEEEPTYPEKIEDYEDHLSEEYPTTDYDFYSLEELDEDWQTIEKGDLVEDKQVKKDIRTKNRYKLVKKKTIGKDKEIETDDKIFEFDKELTSDEEKELEKKTGMTIDYKKELETLTPEREKFMKKVGSIKEE